MPSSLVLSSFPLLFPSPLCPRFLFVYFLFVYFLFVHLKLDKKLVAYRRIDNLGAVSRQLPLQVYTYSLFTKRTARETRE